MSQTWSEILRLILAGDVLVSAHADDELAADQISLRELLERYVAEHYPDFAKRPCVLSFSAMWPARRFMHFGAFGVGHGDPRC